MVLHSGSVSPIIALVALLLAGCRPPQPPVSSTVTTDSVSLQNPVGGGCEGCELMYTGMPETLSAADTSAGWRSGRQPLLLTGTVFQRDGRTPAPGVIIYYWHTDDEGLYAPDATTPPQARDHGRLRGWVKTDAQGRYAIYTARPAPYPGEQIPQHIHLSVKEPDLPNAYFMDLYFDDDPLYLPHKKKYGQQDRGGTELLRILLDGRVQVAEHDIVLGLNIPDYPDTLHEQLISGRNIGEDQPSFMPYHAFGADKGTTACPVCKYGRYQGMVLFLGPAAGGDTMKRWLVFLETESRKRQPYLKTYLVYANPTGYDKNTREAELENLGRDLNISYTALTFVPSFADTVSEVHLNRIHPDAQSTLIIYRHRTIVEKFINLVPDEAGFRQVSAALDRTRGAYFGLSEPVYH